MVNNSVYANEINISVIDETIKIELNNENINAWIGLDVDDVEKVIDMLQKAIVEAKKSPYYEK